MSLYLAALFVASSAGQTSSPQEIVTQRGADLQRVTMSPDSVHPQCWQYRLYQPNTPAFGPRYWGIVEEPSYSKLKDTLVRMRKQQVAWWTWQCKPTRPEPMPYTSFNALGPIAVMDDAAWSLAWSDSGAGAVRSMASRKRRLEAMRTLEDDLYDLLKDKNWTDAFESDLFKSQGVVVYQAIPIATALITLRGLETDLRQASPISIASANADLDVFSSVGQRLRDVADQLGKMKPPSGLVVPAITTEDALKLLNGRFASYTVAAGEGGASSETGDMSFTFFESGFSLVTAPPGWYGGNEPVSFASLDSTTVRYDPQFGGPQRGGIVFLPHDELRSGYRGPAGLILPLGTTPREAESLAQAFRRLVRLGNGVAVPNPAAADANVDPVTAALVEKFRALSDKLLSVGGMKFEDSEIVAHAPTALSTAISRRDGLWRDSEIAGVLQKQVTPEAKFYAGKAAVPMSTAAGYLGVPMALTPTEPPKWLIVRINRSGSGARILVRQASRAMKGKKGPVFTLFRLVEEDWANVESAPKLTSMRVVASGSSQVAPRVTADQLSDEFFRLGGDALKENRLADAEKLLRRSVTMRPGWASAWNWLGVSIVRQGRIDDAAPYCFQSVQINPKFTLGLTNLADIRRVQGQVSESKDLAARAVASAPKDPWARIVLGHACFTNGEFAEAEKHYREAITIEPDNGATHADLAGALLREGKRQDATAEASKALQLGFRSHWVYRELAIPKN